MVEYDENYRSSDTEYRTRRRVPGGGAGLAVGGLGGVAGIVFLLITLFAGGGGGGGLGDILNAQVQAPLDSAVEPPADQRDSFLEFVFDNVQNTWIEAFDAEGAPYEKATFVIFTDAVSTGGCGNASAAVGPFYCPADAKVYLDRSFFDELSTRFGAPGDFAQAYVVAHELGHHVQNVLGISADVRRQQQADPARANELSVLLELQADCLAGVWGHVANEQGILEPGDIEEGLRAAAAVGDDRLQSQAGQRVNPESWTHGSSEQRQDWFDRGFDSGDPEQCDTFG